MIFLTAVILFYSCADDTSGHVEDGPVIVKTGTIDCDIVETSPVVFKNKVYRFEYIRPKYWNNDSGDSYFRFIDRETGQTTPPFGKGFHLGSAFVDNDSVYVTAANSWDGEQIHIFRSGDLKNWDSRLAFELPGYGIFNTSLTHSPKDEYILMFEIGKPEAEAGVRFTARFATSPDLLNWKVLPSDRNYAKDRYTAPHCLRYLDGYYYNFYLEAHDGYEQRLVRSSDLIHWESSPLNPVLQASDEDKRIFNTNLPDELRDKIVEAQNLNNSDIDFCEYNGQLIINYSWGNQQGTEFLAEAIYEGTQAQFLKAWFPD